MKKISVIMGVYNEKEIWLKKTIESILEQSYSNFEFIIILDNPNNELLEKIILGYVKKDNRIIYVKNKKNLGLVKTLNIGMSMSQGDYIARIDADDIAYKERFKIQVEFLERNKDIDLVGTNVEIIDEEGKYIKTNKTIEKNEDIVKLLFWRNMIYHPSILVRRQKLIEIGGYREIEFAEDYDLFCKIGRASCRERVFRAV